MKNKDLMIKIQATLQAIQDGQKVFYNVSFYEKQGLIYLHNVYGKNAVGNKVKIGFRALLTKKAKNILNIII